MEWRPVLGFEDFYEVSEYGHVRNKRTMQVLKWNHYARGYFTVTLCPGSRLRRRTKSVHVIVCEAWHGANPGGMVVCHRDDDRSSHHYSRLRWDTQKANMAEARALGIAAKLTPDEVRSIHHLRLSGLRSPEIAARVPVTEAQVRHILRGFSWPHIYREVMGREPRGWGSKSIFDEGGRDV